MYIPGVMLKIYILKNNPSMYMFYFEQYKSII